MNGEALHCPCQDHLQAALTDGCECGEHVHEGNETTWLLLHPGDAALAAEPPALDVERLRRAVRDEGFGPDLIWDAVIDNIAAEYARLAREGSDGA